MTTPMTLEALRENMRRTLVNSVSLPRYTKAIDAAIAEREEQAKVLEKVRELPEKWRKAVKANQRYWRAAWCARRECAAELNSALPPPPNEVGEKE